MLAGFGAISRRRSTADSEAQRELSDLDRHALPAEFEAVAEALVSGADPVAACAEAGRALARHGASLGEVLDRLRETYRRILDAEPTFSASEAASVAWSESTLEYLHQLSCEDPLTGLASLAHVRTRLDEIYREAEQEGVDVRTAHALVVVEAHPATPDHFGRVLMLAQVADAVRSVFAGGETLGRVRTDRAVAVVRRRPDLGNAVLVLRRYLADLDIEAQEIRVWIEGLPGTPDSAALLLDDLSRA
jgi:GGDEF domain-containing protein